ncbi:unnamed protein product [Urochloa humidicola]
MMREATASMPAARRAPSPRCPPWEALHLVAPFLDAASLASASCVSTSWHAAFAADYLWARLCSQQYPSALALLRHLPDTDAASSPSSSSPHRRLFALFRSASTRSRALPAPPRLALADVAFAVDILTGESGESILSFAVGAAEAGSVRNGAGLFLFGVEVGGRGAAIGAGEWRVRWTAVRTDRRNCRGDGSAPAAVVMMDAKVPAARAAGAVGFGRGEAGVAVGLPAPGCGGARLEAEVVVELAGEDRVVEKVRLGVLCECRYVSADDGLRYLQHFLM